MKTPRFLVPETMTVGTTVLLPTAASHHARRVLRLRADDPVIVFDGNGSEFEAFLVPDPLNASRSCAKITRGGPVDREAKVHICLVQALSAQEKVDWLVEKCVELGARRLILAPTARSIVRLDGPRRERRAQRLREIAAAACCQCGRNRLLAIELADSLDEALRAARDARSCRVLDPASRSGLLQGALQRPAHSAVADSVSLAVGPEGGFTEEEMALAHSLGYTSARLGPRVLRTETAGLAAISALLAIHGEFS